VTRRNKGWARDETAKIRKGYKRSHHSYNGGGNVSKEKVQQIKKKSDGRREVPSRLAKKKSWLKKADFLGQGGTRQRRGVMEKGTMLSNQSPGASQVGRTPRTAVFFKRSLNTRGKKASSDLEEAVI